MATTNRGRPKGPTDQRQRLLAGMTQAAARHGYAGASVARACERAGVSRATFYEHFAGKEECFVAAYAEVEEAILATLERAKQSPPEQRPRQLLTTFLAAAEADPAAARLLTIESRAARMSVRERRHSLQAQIAAAIERCLADLRAEGDIALQVPTEALLGGVENVIAVRLYRGDATRICAHLFDLLSWIDSYALPDPTASAPDWTDLGRQLGAPAPAPGSQSVSRRLPRGKSALPTSEVATHQRERILLAVARLSRTKGYEAMTVADIVRVAEVSRASFYCAFRSKQEAFLAAQTAGLQRSISLAAEAFFGVYGWPDRVWRGLEVTLAYVASQPDLAWVEVAESFAGGDIAIARSFENRRAFTLFLEEGYAQSAQARGLPRLCSEAIGGGILELLRSKVLNDRTETVLELLPAAVYLCLAPFVGPGEALGFVEAKVRERAGRLALPSFSPAAAR